MRALLCLMTFTVISCFPSENYSEETKILQRISAAKGIHHIDKKLYLITGLDGCGACLDYSVNFIKKNIQKNSMLFVISSKSKVALRAKFDRSTIANPNFLFDSTASVIQSGISQNGFPTVLLCKAGRVIEVFEVPYSKAEERFRYAEAFVEKND